MVYDIIYCYFILTEAWTPSNSTKNSKCTHLMIQQFQPRRRLLPRILPPPLSQRSPDTPDERPDWGKKPTCLPPPQILSTTPFYPGWRVLQSKLENELKRQKNEKKCRWNRTLLQMHSQDLRQIIRVLGQFEPTLQIKTPWDLPHPTQCSVQRIRTKQIGRRRILQG